LTGNPKPSSSSLFWKSLSSDGAFSAILPYTCEEQSGRQSESEEQASMDEHVKSTYSAAIYFLNNIFLRKELWCNGSI
jgi:hypothetical protein